MQQAALLKILADGRFHSGAALGQALGVSRATVWKAIKALEALQLDVHSVKGKGHRLASPLELLDPDRLLEGLTTRQREQVAGLDVLMTVDSTNSLLMRRLQDGSLRLHANRCHLCLAEQQTAGRGRRGRSWISPFGSNLYLSLARRFNSGAQGLEGLSLAVGLALLRALNGWGVPGLGLKWPNDLLWRGRKLAGVLLEMSGELNGECQVVIGLGLNLRCRAEDMGEVRQAWVDLQEILGRAPPRNALAAAIIGELLTVLDQFEAAGFRAFRKEWESHDAYRGLTVEIRHDGTATRGRALGLSDNGALRLESPEGERLFAGGEVSLRATA